MWTCPSSSGRARTASTTRSRCHPSGARPSVGRGTTATPTRGAPACRAADSCARCAARRRRSWPSTRARRSRPATRAPPPRWHLLRASHRAVDPDAARAALAGNEFVFDVQGHFLDYWRLDSRRTGLGAGPRVLERVPAADCGEADPACCFSVDHFMEEVFLRSDTSMVALSALPIAPEGSPLSAETMDHARRLTEAACHDQRVLLHAQALPNVGDLQANLDAMSRRGGALPDRVLEGVHQLPRPLRRSGNVWRLDDGDPALARVGDAFLRHAVELGVPTVAAHKGLSTTLGLLVAVRLARRRRTGRTRASRRALPRVPLGLRGRRRRGPVRPGDRRPGRQPARREHAGRGHRTEPERVRRARAPRGGRCSRDPRRPRTCSGKLLVHVGEDNVLWGTDAVFYGSPQGQIQAFRAFQITEQFQEQFGYPALTDEIKRKVLGLNALATPRRRPGARVPCAFTRADLEQLRARTPGRARASRPADQRRAPRLRGARARRARRVTAVSCCGSCRRARRG